MTLEQEREWLLRLNFRPEWVAAYLSERALTTAEAAQARREQELTDQARRLGVAPAHYLAQFNISISSEQESERDG